MVIGIVDGMCFLDQCVAATCIKVIIYSF